ncbi:hypothetical protein RUM43_013141 [Polyplax serrata]|uniref:Uncharacterized protein n=1 Tax=Polyplax serrata TaxID=468196 RepID=A0AAN8P687_POLSC
MSDKKDAEDSPSVEGSSQAESYDANKSGTSETYDMKDFCPGIRIEAKDFDGKWYPAKVSDVDWTENEILVHFENWNTKFDEWIPMDSSRLRSLQKPVHQIKEHVKFAKGEEVMAMWSPYQKYPATIQAVLANDRYDVLFYDGFLKRLKSHKISKLEGQTVKTEVKNFTDIGTKEERRERKRKINVAELFHINKRSRKKGLVHSKSQDIKTYPVSKSKNKSAVIKKPTINDENSERVPLTDSSGVKQKEEKASNSTSVSSKALIDTIPAAFEVKYMNGQTEMWSKQLYQRSEGRTAGKLDIVILNPQGRKFRSRNEIMKYCEENGIIYSHESFDFSAKGRPKSKSSLQLTQSKFDVAGDDKFLLKKGQRKSQLETPGVPILPIAGNPPEMLLPDCNGQNKVFIGDYEVAIENGKFICPVKICAKHFRRENLLHMHMKHYHPEFSKYLDYTPSVTDLAYARTVGGLDSSDVSSPLPRKVSEKTEKPSGKLENVRKSSDTSFEYSKETKKIKLDGRLDGKIYPTKGEVPTTPVEVPETLADEKSKLSLNALLNSKATTAANENDSSALEGSGALLDNKATEEMVPETKGTVSSHTVMKALRRRLNGRKKNSRYQGSFVEQMRKKRLIAQDHSRAHNRVGRQQQSQHLRHQLQQPLAHQTAISSQSCAEDINSNSSSHTNSLPRYPKPMNITNEISGKNNLLTSNKTVSPVSEDVNEQYISDSHIVPETTEVCLDKSQTRRRVNTSKSYNKRRFLAGLINARKRAQYRYRVRRKKKQKLGNKQPSGFSSGTKFCSAGLNEENKKPDEMPFETFGEEHHTNDVNQFAKANLEPHQNVSTSKNCLDDKTKFKESIRIRLKRIDGGTMKLVKTDSNYDENSRIYDWQAVTKESVTQVSRDQSITVGERTRDMSGETFLKTENINEGNVLNNGLNDTKDLDDEYQVSVRGAENEGLKKMKPEPELNPNDLPRSYVLLENVCRKEIYNKYCNGSKRGNDENVMSRKIKRKNRVARKGDPSRRRKKVRFQNTIVEKWINSDEIYEFGESKLGSYKTNSKGREARRDERKKKLTKGQPLEYLNRREVNQVKWSDDTSREEQTLAQNNSGLGEFRFEYLPFSVSIPQLVKKENKC